MAVTVYSRNDTDIILAQQGIWGTAVADGVAGTILDVEAAVIEPDINERRPNRSNSGQRSLLKENIQLDFKGSMPSLMLKGDAKVGDLAHFLYAVIQNESEAIGSPFLKTFTFPATQPDFTAIAAITQAGWLGTFIEKHPLASQSSKMADAIGTELTLSCDPDAGMGRLQMAGKFIGRGQWVTSATGAGSHARSAQTFFYFHDINVFSYAGVALNPLSVEVKISQPRTKGVSTNLTGDVLTYAIPEYVITAKFKVLWNAAAKGIKNQWGLEYNQPLIISWGSATPATGYLNIAINAELLKAPTVIGDLNAIEFEVQGVWNGATKPVTILLADGVDRTWA